MVRLAGLRLALTTAAPPPEDRPAYPPIGKGDAEVSWLRVIADGAFPTPPDGWISGPCRGLATYSCGGSAGLAPDFPVASHADANMTASGISTKSRSEAA